MTWQHLRITEDPDVLRFDDDPAELYAFDLADFLNRPAWMADAACREHPELTWFPARGESLDQAREVCAGCLVAQECRTFALEQPGWLSGIWGGTSERERRRGRAGQQEAA